MGVRMPHNFFIPTLVFLAGFCAHSAFQHYGTAKGRPQRNAHLLFAAISLLMALFVLSSACSYQATTIDDYVKIFRFNVAIFGMLMAVVPWFFAEYTGVESKKLLIVLTSLYSALYLFSMTYPYAFTFYDAQGLERITLPWGEEISHLRGSPGSWVYLWAIISIIPIAFGFYTLIVHFRRDHRNRSLIMMFALVLFLIGIITGIMFRFGGAHIPPLGPLGFVGMVVVMGLTLNFEIQKERTHLQAILDRMPAHIFIKNISGKYLMVNRQFEEIFNISGKDVLGKTDYDLFPKEQAEAFRANDQQVVTTRTPLEYEEHLTLDGTIHTYLSTKFSLLDDYNQPYAICGIATDISEYKKIEDGLKRHEEQLEQNIIALEDSEKRFRALIEEAPIAISMVRNQTYLYSSPAHARIFGFDNSSEIIGTPVSDSIAPQDRQMVSGYSQKLRNGEIKSVQFEIIGVRRDGSQFPYLVSSTAIYLSDGPASIIFGVDITERRRAQDFMVQSEKMTMIAGMAAGIAHEVNNPLGIIAQDLQNLERRFSPALQANCKVADELGIDLEAVNAYMVRREISGYITTMRNAVKRASVIISNMLQFSRQSDASHLPANLNDIIEQSIKLASSDYDLRKKYDFKNVAIIREYSEQLPLTSLSITEMEQVVINILKNAAQAMFEAGTSKPSIRINTFHNGVHVVAVIEDNGPGMSEAVRQRIYDPFFTTKDVGAGTGLGLSVSYAILTKNHGGELAVESKPGQGARFTIKLPLT